jgi:phage terminase Nu1 subunit (DNA packaging protein)
MMSETSEPKSEGKAAATYPATVIAKLLLLTERRVQQLAGEGVIPKAERGRYALAPAVQGYVRYLKDRAGGGDAETDEIGTSKARLIKARARMAELEADALEGKLLDRAEVERAWKTIVLNMRAKLMAIPVRAAPQIVTAPTIAQAAAMLERLVSEALNELAEQPIEGAPAAADDIADADRGSQVGAGDGGPAAEADAIGVG